MKKISYKVQGSAKKPYTIVIKKNNNKIQCLCDCNAGRNKMHCKHWMGVFEGKKQEYIGISKEQSIIRLMKILRKKGNSYKKISEVITKSTRKKFAQSWVFNILKRESTIPTNEEIIRHNVCNVELQPSVCDV